RAERAQAEHAHKSAATAGRKRLALYGGAALVGIAVAAVVVVPLARRNAAAVDRDEPHAVVEPIVHPAEADKPLGSDNPIDRPLEAPSPGDVRVVSEPAGAQVYAGPKLVGTAPVTLHIGTKAGGEPVTLVRSGYEDLNYTVQAGDGPSLTLRMLKHHHTAVAQPPPASKDKGPHKAKVDTFDDDSKSPHVPKVQAIDD
ncbi:MAG TPA: PEGA domain-containing protein, partial [Polyangia bacterium]